MDNDTETTVVTPEQFLARMAVIAEDDDQESAHCDADDLLCEVLASLGFGDGVAIFAAMPKWYA